MRRLQRRRSRVKSEGLWWLRASSAARLLLYVKAPSLSPNPLPRRPGFSGSCPNRRTGKSGPMSFQTGAIVDLTSSHSHYFQGRECDC
jgi:hypothetical protein